MWVALAGPHVHQAAEILPRERLDKTAVYPAGQGVDETASRTDMILARRLERHALRASFQVRRIPKPKRGIPADRVQKGLAIRVVAAKAQLRRLHLDTPTDGIADRLDPGHAGRDGTNHLRHTVRGQEKGLLRHRLRQPRDAIRRALNPRRKLAVVNAPLGPNRQRRLQPQDALGMQ